MKIALRDKVPKITKECFFTAKVEGYPIEIDAYVIDEIGKDEEGNKIKIIFGALAMQKWGILPILHEERLDMANYLKEFVEYTNEKI